MLGELAAQLEASSTAEDKAKENVNPKGGVAPEASPKPTPVGCTNLSQSKSSLSVLKGLKKQKGSIYIIGFGALLSEANAQLVFGNLKSFTVVEVTPPT